MEGLEGEGKEEKVRGLEKEKVREVVERQFSRSSFLPGKKRSLCRQSFRSEN